MLLLALFGSTSQSAVFFEWRIFTSNQPILLQNTNCTTCLSLLESGRLVDLDKVGLGSLDAVLAGGVVRQHDANLGTDSVT